MYYVHIDSEETHKGVGITEVYVDTAEDRDAKSLDARKELVLLISSAMLMAAGGAASSQDAQSLLIGPGYATSVRKLGRMRFVLQRTLLPVLFKLNVTGWLSFLNSLLRKM